MKLLIAFAAAALVLVVVFVVVLRSLGGGADVDCQAFSPRPGQWERASPDARGDLQIKLAACRTLHGRTPEEVQALLGAPSAPRTTAGTGLTYRFGPGDIRLMEVVVQGGRVVELRRVTESGPVP